jgi:hypothetical protein
MSERSSTAASESRLAGRRKLAGGGQVRAGHSKPLTKGIQEIKFHESVGNTLSTKEIMMVPLSVEDQNTIGSDLS